MKTLTRSLEVPRSIKFINDKILMRENEVLSFDKIYCYFNTIGLVKKSKRFGGNYTPKQNDLIIISDTLQQYQITEIGEVVNYEAGVITYTNGDESKETITVMPKILGYIERENLTYEPVDKWELTIICTDIVCYGFNKPDKTAYKIATFNKHDMLKVVDKNEKWFEVISKGNIIYVERNSFKFYIKNTKSYENRMDNVFLNKNTMMYGKVNQISGKLAIFTEHDKHATTIDLDDLVTGQLSDYKTEYAVLENIFLKEYTNDKMAYNQIYPLIQKGSIIYVENIDNETDFIEIKGSQITGFIDKQGGNKYVRREYNGCTRK